MTTPDEQTVERVKNAIGFQAWGKDWPPHQTETLTHDMYERMARAAIAAMPDTKALEAADELADAIMHEREMVCQDMELQAKVAKRLGMALTTYRAARGCKT